MSRIVTRKIITFDYKILPLREGKNVLKKTKPIFRKRIVVYKIKPTGKKKNLAVLKGGLFCPSFKNGFNKEFCFFFYDKKEISKWILKGAWVEADLAYYICNICKKLN